MSPPDYSMFSGCPDVPLQVSWCAFRTVPVPVPVPFVHFRVSHKLPQDCSESPVYPDDLLHIPASAFHIPSLKYLQLSNHLRLLHMLRPDYSVPAAYPDGLLHTASCICHKQYDPIPVSFYIFVIVPIDKRY